MRYPPSSGSTVVGDPNARLDAVTHCPFCASERVATTGKAVTVSSYWRCEACGEIWNPGRAGAASNSRALRW